MLSTLIITPILRLVVFGYAIDLDVDRIPTLVCDQDRTPQSRDLAQTFFVDRTFLRRADVLNPSAAQDVLEEGRDAAALIVPRAADAMRSAVN
jgi:ABC-2 type transport system permease protein